MKNGFKTEAKKVAVAAIFLTATFISSGSQAKAGNISSDVQSMNSIAYLTFDWHANGRARSPEKLFLIGGSTNWISKKKANGKGAYVCSLSGAGQRSRCSMRR